MPARARTATPNKEIAAAFPEIAENLALIRDVQDAQHTLFLRNPRPSTSASAAQPSLLDPHTSTCALGRDVIENRLESFGGRGHQGTVAGLVDLHQKQTMPLPPNHMPSPGRAVSRAAQELTSQEAEAARAARTGQGPRKPKARNPYTGPAFGRRAKGPQQRPMPVLDDSSASSVADLSAAGMAAQSAIAAKPRFESPLTWDERVYLGSAPWRLGDATLDAHDRAVVNALPYAAHKVVDNDQSIGVLGKVLRSTSHKPVIRAAAIAALGDKGNYGKNACLAHLVPQLNSKHPELRAKALTAISQVSVSGQERQYCEIEFVVHSAVNLPKKDRFGACDAYVKVSLVTPHGTKDGAGRAVGPAAGEEGGAGGRGWVRKKEQTRIIWRDLNPVWKQAYNWEVWDPDREVVEMSVWDEDGETDDFVGSASLSLYELSHDQLTGEMPQLSRSLNLYGPGGEMVRGFNNITSKNDGPPTKLLIKARYVTFLRPSDLMNGLLSQLEDPNPLPRIAASRAMQALAPPGGDDAMLAALQMLWDDSHAVRAQAVRDCQWVGRGNPKDVISRLGRMLEEGATRERRRVVISGMAAVVDGGVGEGEFAAALRELGARLESGEEEVRVMAAEGIGLVAGRGDRLAADEVCRRLAHPRAEVRAAAAQALALVARAGDGASLEELSPLLEDTDASVRHAAVQAAYYLGDVGAGAAEEAEGVRRRAKELLWGRVMGNQGRGDTERTVRRSAERLHGKLDKEAKRCFMVYPAQYGAYSSLIPAATVRAGKGAQAASSLLVEEMPKDNKFHSTLPFRPPSPPWDPKSQDRRRLKAVREQCEADIAVALHQMREISKHGPEAVGEAEEKELAALQKHVDKLHEQDARAAAEFQELFGPEEVQPNNTTKLGFSIRHLVAHGDHCTGLTCARSKYY